MPSRILLVEDDPKIAELVGKQLAAAGYEYIHCAEGNGALAEFERREPDLLVLDLMLPGTDGLEIARRVRGRSKVPILMLTARSSESDLVLGFEVGADDYLTKPFSTGELMARIRALLRRSGRGEQEEILKRGDLSIDTGSRAVHNGDDLVELTSLEFDLLYLLARKPGRVYSRQALLDQVWGDDRIVEGRSIDSLVSRLRRKLETDPAKPRYIQTVWGAGYRFAPQDS